MVWAQDYIQYSTLTIEGNRRKYNGCGKILVLDGNMKNHRDVCAAREAGYAQFHGLPGEVKNITLLSFSQDAVQHTHQRSSNLMK